MSLKNIFITTYIALLQLVIVRGYSQSILTWFEFKPTIGKLNHDISLETWLDKPAGKHGFVKMVGEQLIFEDGTPVKFWGTNLCSELPFMNPEEVVKWGKYSFLSELNYKFYANSILI